MVRKYLKKLCFHRIVNRSFTNLRLSEKYTTNGRNLQKFLKFKKIILKEYKFIKQK